MSALIHEPFTCFILHCASLNSYIKLQVGPDLKILGRSESELTVSGAPNSSNFIFKNT